MEKRPPALFRALGSVKLTLALLLILAVVTGAATLVESAHGTAYAQAVVYRTRWFEGLLLLLAINMIVMFFSRWSTFQRHQIGFVITHFSVIVILVGAGITRFFGYEGVMTIREGSSSDFLFSRDDYIQLRSNGETANSEILLYKPGPQNIQRDLTVGGETFHLALTEYWPHLTRQLQEGEGGVPMVALAVSTGQQAENVRLEAGETETVGGTELRFHGSGPLPPLSDGARGVLRATLGDRTESLPIPVELPAEISLDGLRVRIVELDPDFKVGREAAPDAPMNNPALRVEVTGADGRAARRQLFALHPEFSMGDSLTGAARALQLRYDWSRSLHLALAPDGQVQAAADFPLRVASSGHLHSEEDGEPIAAGNPFTLGPRAMLDAGSFGLQLQQAWRSAVRVPAPSSSEDDPPGARLTIRDASGVSTEEIVLVRTGDQKIRLGDRTVDVAIGPIRIPVGYQLHLDDFVLVTYPGSNNPASFESHVRIHDPEHGVDGRPFRIYMNHPLTYRGFKHFQSSYDSDRKGTVLSVNNDPGKWPTYVGYTLMTLGFLITLSRGVLWYRKSDARPAMKI